MTSKIPEPGDIWRTEGGLRLIVEDVSLDGVLASCQNARAWRHTPLDEFLATTTYAGHDEQLLWICSCGTANVLQDPRPYPKLCGTKTVCRSCQNWTRVQYEQEGARAKWKAHLGARS